MWRALVAGLSAIALVSPASAQEPPRIRAGTIAGDLHVDGVLETTDLRQIQPWQKITLRFGREARTYTRSSYVGIRVLAVLGMGWPLGAPGGRKAKGE